MQYRGDHLVLYNIDHIRIQLIIIIITIGVPRKRNVFIYVCCSNVKNISSVFDLPSGSHFRYLYKEKIQTHQLSYPDPQVGLIR